jgi:hypothetical protein
MSILDTLLRFVDPIAHRERQEERRRKREAVPPDAEGDDVGVLPERPPSAAADRRFGCRICAYETGSEHRFCPRCLAETMVPVPGPKR